MLHADFVDMVAAFNDAQVEYLVVGAHALGAYGLSRATRDFDLFVRRTPENADRVLRALARFGAPAGVASKEDLLNPNIVVQIGVEPVRVDLMSDISGVAFDEAWPERVVVRVDETPMVLIGRRHLVANKRASGRKKDLLDAEWLEAHPS
jgi:hypothetical protein